jgi:hypothetical protein
MNLLNQFDRQKIIWIIYKNIIYFLKNKYDIFNCFNFDTEI